MPGARRSGSTRGSGPRASSWRRPPRRRTRCSTGSWPRRARSGPASASSRSTRPRSWRAAPRRSSVAASSRQTTPPSSRHGWRSGCEPACRPAACGCSSARASTLCTRPGRGRSRRGPPAAGSAPALRCSRSTPRPAACGPCARVSRSPPRTSCSPSRSPTCSSGSAGPGESRSPTAAPSCTTSAPRPTGGSRSAGAAGALAYGARLNGRVERDPATAAVTAEHLRELFPLLAGRRLTHAWGGPIDVSPSHLPQVGTLSDGPVHYAFGFTGNGVGPSHLAGRILSGLALDARDADTRLALVDPAPAVVPPEPLAWIGGSLVRAAFLRRERIEAEGRRPDALTRAITTAPKALGIHVGR